MLKVPAKQDSKSWVDVSINLEDGRDETFQLLLARPTFEDLLADQESFTGYVWQRVKRCVLDWKGIMDENSNPIPFSLENFQAVCVALPLFLPAVSTELMRLYAGATRSKDEKNSLTPSAESSRVATGGVAGATAGTTTDASEEHF